MALAEDVVALRAEVPALREALAQAQARSAALERRKTPPCVVRATASTERPAPPRRTRAPAPRIVLRRAEPTQIVSHAEERCPDGGSLVRGQSGARTRQVSDQPEPAPVESTAQRPRKGHCPVCERWWTPHVDGGGPVPGQGRLGGRLIRVSTSLRQRARLPLRTIQHLLATLYAVRLWRGALVDLPQRLQHATRQEQDALLEQARASPIVHRDETGWRQNGQNGDV